MEPIASTSNYRSRSPSVSSQSSPKKSRSKSSNKSSKGSQSGQVRTKRKYNKRKRVYTYLNKKVPIRKRLQTHEMELGIQSINPTIKLKNKKFPKKVCKIITNECRPKDPNTKRYIKIQPDGSENYPYAINVAYI